MRAAVEIPAIIEMDVERDRKTCIALHQKADGASRELAQWLMDHPRYMATTVAGWLDCSATRVKNLRRWAQSGYLGAPRNASRKTQLPGVPRRPVSDSPLEINENFEDDTFEPDDNVEDPSIVLHNILDSIKQSKSVAEAYRKILKASSFDRAAKKEISDAIELLIRKWRSVQSTLTAKGKANGPQDH
jgi:hypothetical protein